MMSCDVVMRYAAQPVPVEYAANSEHQNIRIIELFDVR